MRAVTEPHERVQRLETELRDQVTRWRLSPVVEAIQALRGVDLTGAVIVVAELGDLTRFDTPRQLMSSLGLTPSEYSSGERRRQGGITKAGNTHAPRALVAGACLSVPGQGQPASATPAGEAAAGGTGHRLEGAGAAGQTVSAVERPREARQPGRGGHGREMAAL